MQHELKTWPTYFSKLLIGSKTYEIRKDDRGFKVGDTLLLKEWDPQTEKFTGRQMVVSVPYLTRGPAWGLPPDLVVMAVQKTSC